MIVALDGPPDAELNENTRLLDEMEATSKNVKKELSSCKDQLTDRMHMMKDEQWKQSKERTLFDEEIKTTFKSCES